MSDPSQKILIVGAGVFGLSTALFLARRGYKDITVIDRIPLEVNQYHPDAGCDGASADINKVFRTGYGVRHMYEKLAFRALPVWQEWNATIKNSSPEELPTGITPDDDLLVQCGVMRLGEGKELDDYHAQCLQGAIEQGHRDDVYLINDAHDLARAAQKDKDSPGMHWASKLQRYGVLIGGNIHGMLDMEGGFTRADKSCLYALHLCKKAGVKFILDQRSGAFDKFIIHEGKTILGVVTKDGKEHRADKTIVAAGGWTASIVPEVSSLLETTAGSLCFIDIPENRPDLRKKYSPAEFCGWSLKLKADPGDHEGSYRSMGGFPADPNGRLKFGFRATKFTNYETLPNGQKISVPRTAFTENNIDNIPKKALEAIKSNIMSLYPDLAEFGLTGTRMCWYTDSIDCHFLADYVPDTNESLFIASGGSGHGFKFLPIFGENFVNQLEKKEDEFTQYWKWRSAIPGESANGLEEGPDGPRTLDKAAMATRADWKFATNRVDKLANCRADWKFDVDGVVDKLAKCTV
ncbi:hypothetical protein J010_06495 [Cryptococcus neoformans]|nr:hypothetical protein C355_06513 [Cryptococcus neoformans var. grubii Th84]OXH00961.1 hypothetical protein J010_06495 [Cryptococcus neoformans var. grubii]OXH22756.1 hypothetical protein J009_06485 [Cryptococcus neoformans var. grubii]OXH42781.1 hypothetical protein J004_06507 [Cryptococcus neoformans var. grubii]OXH43411.1 hypothetical protein J003_06479 [Cryptococcus neoformans var. grubii]